MGHSRPLVSLFSSFQQLTRIHVHYEILADDWIQIADLLYQKQLLCQLSHNHCTNFAFFIESISVLFRLSLVLVNQQMYTYLSYHYPSPGFEVRPQCLPITTTFTSDPAITLFLFCLLRKVSLEYSNPRPQLRDLTELATTLRTMPPG